MTTDAQLLRDLLEKLGPCPFSDPLLEKMIMPVIFGESFISMHAGPTFKEVGDNIIYLRDVAKENKLRNTHELWAYLQGKEEKVAEFLNKLVILTPEELARAATDMRSQLGRHPDEGGGGL